MTCWKAGRTAIVSSLACALLLPQWVFASYMFTVLPTVPDGYNSRPIAINNFGVIVGNTDFAAPCFNCGGSTQATLWTSSGVSLLGGYGRSNYAFDINDSGQVAGTSYIYTGNQAEFWTGGIPYILENGSKSGATGINNSGQVAGYREAGATIWNGLDGATYLRPNYLKSSTAVDVNDVGQVIGTLDENSVLWTDGVPVVLGITRRLV